MSLWRMTIVALRGLRAHKLRSFLTMLGVVIGVGAVIVMMSMGQGAQSQMEANMTRLGSNLLWVRPGAFRRHGVSMGSVRSLTVEDAYAIEAELGEWTDGVSPEVSRGEQVKYFAKNVRTVIRGTTANYADVRNMPTQEGRWFSDADVQLARRVCVIGTVVAEKLFEGGAAVGRVIKVRGQNFKILGLLEEKGESWMNPDDQVIIPLTTAQRALVGEESLGMITIRAKNAETHEQTMEKVKELVRRRHRIAAGDDDDFTVRNQQEFLESLNSSMAILTMLLSGVAAVSLLVGGIGIMNIMLVTVTERTREIGIRKAVGATRFDIMKQFLIEAVVLSATGGIIGIAVGVAGSWKVAQMAGWPLMVPMHMVGLAVVVSAGTGIVFGVFPALKAARLNPIEALRYE